MDQAIRRPTTFLDSSTFVGRVQELDFLAAALREASLGAPRIVLLGGDAGVGKTCLARELRAVARRTGFRICAGRAQEDAAYPFLPFEPLFLEIAGERAPGASELARDIAVVKRVMARADSDKESPTALADLEFLQLFSAVSRATLALSRRRATLLAIDDLQWADRSSIDLFAQLVFALSDSAGDERVPLAVVATHRPVAPDHPLARVLPRVQQEPIARTLELQGLAEFEILELCQQLGVGRPSRQLIGILSEATQGNPLLVREAIGWLEREELLREQRGEVVATVRAEDLVMPERSSAFAIRTSATGPESERMLELAAVLGDGFTPELLVDLCGQPQGEIRELLSDARRHALLVREGERYRFAHSLIRRAYRSRTDAPERRQIHARAARALMDREPEDREPLLPDIARHLVAAGPAADPRDVLRQVARAGDRAFAAFAWGKASELYEAALAAAERLPQLGPAERADLHYRAGLAHERNLEFGPATTRLEGAIQAYAEAGDLRGRALALCAHAYACYTRSGASYGRAIDPKPLEEVLAELPFSEAALRGRVSTALSELFWTARQTDRAAEMARAALDIGRALQDDALCSRASGCRALAELQRLGVPRARRRYEEAASYAHRAGDPWLEGKALQRIPLVLGWQGQLGRAGEVATEACALARRNQDWAGHSHALAALSSLDLARGELDAAIRHAREAMTAVRRSQYPWSGPTALPAAAAVRWLRGEWEAARDALALLVEPGRVFEEASPAMRLLVWVYDQLVAASAGSTDALRAAFAQWPRDSRQHFRADAYAIGAFCSLVEIAERIGEPDIAAAFRPTLVAALESGATFSTGWVFLLPRVLGVEAALGKRWDEAEYFFEVAERTAGDVGARVELARTRLDWAAMLAARHGAGDRERAAGLLTEAAHEFIELRMRPFAERAAALGRGLDLELPGAERLDERRPDGLDPLELEVLGQMARGRANQAIADELLLCCETVERAVASILAKTGVTGRPGAIAYALEQDLQDSERQTARGRRAAVDAVRETEARRYGESRILFLTDMEGSTPLIERLGDAEALEIMRAHNTLIRECLRAHGGLEHAQTGDGLLATFRSAAAAVRCSQDIQRGFRQHNQSGSGEPIRVRVGIHAGEIHREEDRFFGAAVNAVFRICDRASPGEIVGSEAIRQLAVDPSFHFEDRGAVPLKGFSDPFRIYTILW